MTTPLPRILRIAAALVLAATLGTWFGTGMHWGWTRTTVTEMRHDAITGIDYPVERAKFVAGVEVLATGAGLAGVFALSGYFLTRRRPAAAITR